MLGEYSDIVASASPVGRKAIPKTWEGPLIRLHIGLEAPADLRRGLDAYSSHG